MPLYMFQCPKCKKEFETVLTMSEMDVDTDVIVVKCVKCGTGVPRENTLINFAGCINMNSSAFMKSSKKYSNKGGGPRPIINGKVQDDAKPKW